MVSHHLQVQLKANWDWGRKGRNRIMKTAKQKKYDEEAYELDNVYNDDDMYGEWYAYRNVSSQSDETLYKVSKNETSIWYN